MLTSDVDLTGRCLLQHDMLDEDRLLHEVSARRWPFSIIRRDKKSHYTPCDAQLELGCLVVVPAATLNAAHSSHLGELGEAQIEQTSANQAINSPKLKAVFLY